MPNITVEGPRLADIHKKRKLVDAITTAATEAYELPRQAIVVLLKENAPDNVAVGGELLVDRRAKQDGAG